MTSEDQKASQEVALFQVQHVGKKVFAITLHVGSYQTYSSASNVFAMQRRKGSLAAK